MRTVQLLVAWLWIALPLSWGVYHSALKALPLFAAKPSPVLAPALPPAK
jgi:hypothetical protein